jgi:hypothetical protein
MVKHHECEKCGKVFYQKGHCKPIENKLIEEKVQ